MENTTQSFLASLYNLLTPALADTVAAVAPENSPTESAPPASDPIATDVGATATGADKTKDNRTLLLTILSGEVPISLILEFLFRANHADLSILSVSPSAPSRDLDVGIFLLFLVVD